MANLIVEKAIEDWRGCLVEERKGVRTSTLPGPSSESHRVRSISWRAALCVSTYYQSETHDLLIF